MRLIPPDHADRKTIADEVHARPSQPMETPSSAIHLAVLIDPESRAQEFQHLSALLASANLPPPAADANQHTARIGASLVKWERHGEFSSVTIFSSAPGTAPANLFEPRPQTELPSEWLVQFPGKTVLAARAELVKADGDAPDPALLRSCFDGNVVVGAEIGGGAAYAFTDFVTRADGFERLLLLDRSFTPRQAGRMLQRLFEIKTYRIMSLLALPVVRRLMPQISAAERALSDLTQHLATSASDDESLLEELTSLAVDVQEAITSSQFRLNACRAYADLVRTRIAELREQRIAGIQPIEEFMARRFTPAVATCASAGTRLRDLSERVGNMSSLLSTRVDIVRKQQNQRVLESMNVRAERQFHVQKAVESLSVAAIVYYGAQLVGHIAAALKSEGFPVRPEIAEVISIPVIAMVCLWALWRAHRNATKLKTLR